MPKKYPDETVYMRVSGKYIAIGKLYDSDHISYGNYFVSNKKYCRGIHWIGAAPDPDFIRLETAVEESRDNIRDAVRNIVSEFVNDPTYLKYDYKMVDDIIQAIRKTYIDKKKQMLEDISK